jgi:hypothetical protein
MATKAYSIVDLLDGKLYRSNSRNTEGVIVWAEPRPEIWYGEDYEAYTIKVRPQFERQNPLTWGKDFYATVAVKVNN